MPRKSPLILPVPNTRTIAFGNTFRQLRLGHKLTLAQVNELTGVDMALLSRLETGQKHVPDPETIDELGNKLNYDPFEVELLRAAGEYTPRNQKFANNISYFQVLEKLGLKTSDLDLLTRSIELMDKLKDPAIVEGLNEMRMLLAGPPNNLDSSSHSSAERE